jgi:hypothetical protein
MPYLRYLYVFVLSGDQQILCCVFDLFLLCLLTICCQFFLDRPFGIL